MESEIKDRFEQLITKGQKIIDEWPKASRDGLRFWSPDDVVPNVQSWIQSSANLLDIVIPSNRPMLKGLQDILNDNHYVSGTSVPSHTVQKILGLLQSAYEEINLGLFKKIEYAVMAETFDDFLDHAFSFHKAGKKIEAAVLSSVVLEDTLKKIALKNDVNPKGKSLEDIVDELAKKEVFNAVKAKRIKSENAIRNHALHAEWEEFDIKQVGEQIKSIQSLIEDYL